MTGRSAQCNRGRASEKALRPGGEMPNLCYLSLPVPAHSCKQLHLLDSIDTLTLSHSLNEGFIFNNSVFIIHSFKTNISLWAGRVLLALGPIAQLQDSTAWSPHAVVPWRGYAVGLSLAAGSEVPAMHGWAQPSPDKASDVIIPGNLCSALTFTSLSCRIFSQNKIYWPWSSC